MSTLSMPDWQQRVHNREVWTLYGERLAGILMDNDIFAAWMDILQQRDEDFLTTFFAFSHWRTTVRWRKESEPGSGSEFESGLLTLVTSYGRDYTVRPSYRDAIPDDEGKGDVMTFIKSLYDFTEKADSAQNHSFFAYTFRSPYQILGFIDAMTKSKDHWDLSETLAALLGDEWATWL